MTSQIPSQARIMKESSVDRDSHAGHTCACMSGARTSVFTFFCTVTRHPYLDFAQLETLWLAAIWHCDQKPWCNKAHAILPFWLPMHHQLSTSQRAGVLCNASATCSCKDDSCSAVPLAPSMRSSPSRVEIGDVAWHLAPQSGRSSLRFLLTFLFQHLLRVAEEFSSAKLGKPASSACPSSFEHRFK